MSVKAYALAMQDAQSIISALGLRPHPEGGHYRETWRAWADPGDRAAGSAIYYLLQAGERSHWHRIDAAEVWHFYAGDPLALWIAPESGLEAPTQDVLGPAIDTGQRPQVIVPPGHWQSAASTGHWTLVGCTVSPGFRFEAFELADPDWQPGHRR